MNNAGFLVWRDLRVEVHRDLRLSTNDTRAVWNGVLTTTVDLMLDMVLTSLGGDE